MYDHRWHQTSYSMPPLQKSPLETEYQCDKTTHRLRATECCAQWASTQQIHAINTALTHPPTCHDSDQWPIKHHEKTRYPHASDHDRPETWRPPESADNRRAPIDRAPE